MQDECVSPLLHFSKSYKCEFQFIGLFRYSSVIANQSADWCGNPQNIPETLGDCHVGLRPPRNDTDIRYCSINWNFIVAKMGILWYNKANFPKVRLCLSII